MTNNLSTRHLRSLIPATATITAATLTMDNGTTINMAIGGDVSAFWGAVSDYCDRCDNDRRPFNGGTIWLSNEGWIESDYEYDGDHIVLHWVRRSRPPIPVELLQADRFCACGCGLLLSKTNRSGYAAKCYTKCPDVRSRLATSRKAARAKAKAKNGAIG